MKTNDDSTDSEGSTQSSGTVPDRVQRLLKRLQEERRGLDKDGPRRESERREVPAISVLRARAKERSSMEPGLTEEVARSQVEKHLQRNHANPRRKVKDKTLEWLEKEVSRSGRASSFEIGDISSDDNRPLELEPRKNLKSLVSKLAKMRVSSKSSEESKGKPDLKKVESSKEEKPKAPVKSSLTKETKKSSSHSKLNRLSESKTVGVLPTKTRTTAGSQRKTPAKTVGSSKPKTLTKPALSTKPDAEPRRPKEPTVTRGVRPKPSEPPAASAAAQHQPGPAPSPAGYRKQTLAEEIAKGLIAKTKLESSKRAFLSSSRRLFLNK